MNISNQVLGHRAKEIYELFTVDSKAISNLRYRIQKLFQDEVSNIIPRLSSTLFYPWYNFLCHQPPTTFHSDPAAFQACAGKAIAKFSQAEQSWVHAWFQVTRPTKPPSVRMQVMAPEEITACYTLFNPDHFEQLQDLSLSREYHSVNLLRSFC